MILRSSNRNVDKGHSSSSLSLFFSFFSYHRSLLLQFLNAVQIRGDVAVDDLVFIVEEGEMDVLVQKNLRGSLYSIYSTEEAAQRNRICPMKKNIKYTFRNTMVTEIEKKNYQSETRSSNRE